VTALTEIWTYRTLIGNLAQRELKSRYKKSALGWAWSLINPAATLGIYTVVFGVFLKQKAPVAGNGEFSSFGLYLFAALIMWNFFNATVMGSIGALQGAGPLLKKVYFPPECAAIANMLTVLTQTALEAGIMVVIMIAVGNVSWTFLLFPFVVVMLMLFSLGLGLMVSIWNVYFRDIGYLVGIAMNLLFYATPIIYSLQTVSDSGKHGPQIANLLRLNPMTQFTLMSRDLFYTHTLPSGWAVIGTLAASVGMFVVGYAIFVRKALNVSEEL
jgi:ABC-2 type transport system permease protein